MHPWFTLFSFFTDVQRPAAVDISLDLSRKGGVENLLGLLFSLTDVDDKPNPDIANLTFCSPSISPFRKVSKFSSRSLDEFFSVLLLDLSHNFKTSCGKQDETKGKRIGAHVSEDTPNVSRFLK